MRQAVSCKDPVTVTRRILLCTLGATPQIVTETAEALMHDDVQGWRPDIVEIITTAPSVPTIVAGLSGPMQPWAALFGETAPPLSIFAPARIAASPFAAVLAWSEGQPMVDPDLLMQDVANTDESERMADAIKERLWHWVQQDDTAVHLSIAGGRKTMSAHALIALALLGRAQDEASHVLVDKDFENRKDFWHRRQGGLILSPRQMKLSAAGQDPGPPEHDPALVRVNLMRVPVPLVAEIKETDRSVYGTMSFTVLLRQIALANRFRAAPSLVLNDGANTVTICGQSAKLPPVEYAKLRLLAEAVKTGWETEATRLPDYKKCLAADNGRVFLPIGVLMGWTAGVNRVQTVLIPALAKAQTVAGLEEDQSENAASADRSRAKRASRKSRPTPQEALNNLAADNDDALTFVATSGDFSSSRLRTAHTSAVKQLGSFTELRGILASAFGDFLANALLPQSAARPRAARFRLNCPPDAITIMTGAA
jgi:CRISPR-associated protein (TIGR02584 family)